MADKIISLVNTQRYVRHRDIWDLRWLKKQDAKINHTFVARKIQDYHIEGYPQKLDDRIDNIVAITSSPDFTAELSRFTPLHVQERTLNKDKFLLFLANEIRDILTTTRKRLGD